MGSMGSPQTSGRAMKSLVSFAVLLSGATAIHDYVLSSANNNFTGFKVYRTHPGEKYQTDYLNELRQSSRFFDFWTEVRPGRTVDIMTPPGMGFMLEAELKEQNIHYEIMIEDVQRQVDLEKIPSDGAKNENPRHSMTWTEYHTLDDIYSYLDYLEQTFDFVSTEIVGQSEEGRDMRVARVCKGGCGGKKAVWIDGGIHAREWIAPATVTWMLKELVENDTAHPDLTETLDWYFLPSHNPDGYAYTRDNNRMWRKTRSDNGGIFGCKGVDANRNYGHHWNEGGSSNDRCSDTYHGPAAWSETENVHVSNYVMERQGDWGFFNEMLEIAVRGEAALEAVHGKTYDVGCIPCLLYTTSGSTIDWAHGEAGIFMTVSMELRVTGLYGFLLPPDQIIPTAEETWAFHASVMRELMQR